jgi:hypothetical protein
MNKSYYCFKVNYNPVWKHMNKQMFFTYNAKFYAITQVIQKKDGHNIKIVDTDAK